MRGARSKPAGKNPVVSILKNEIELGYEGPFSYMRTVQPVFDRHCIGCHGLKAPGKDEKKPMSLVGSQAPMNLMERKQVKWAESYSETGESKPKDYFSAASPLTALLKKGHHNVKLTQSEWGALILWMDMNVSQFSDGFYGFNRLEQRKPDSSGETRLRVEVEARFGKEVAAQPFDALVNVGEPEKSRILLAALPAEKGGWGQFKGGYPSRDDPEYRVMLALVQGSITPMVHHDYCGTCGRGKECVCGSCWVWMGHYNEPKPDVVKQHAANQ
jgi:hypothetical protein